MHLSASLIWQQQKEAYASFGIESWAKGNVPFHMTNNARIAAQYAEIALCLFPNQPFTVLELGGGSGKFAFLFLQALARRGISNVHYILTDGAPKNVSFWQKHPLLKENGSLKMALLDPLAETMPPADLVIANYFFDTIPHDLFCVEQGVLLEGNSLKPIRENPYPDLPEAFSVLEEKRDIDRPPFLFPIGALRAIQNAPLVLASDRESCSVAPSSHGDSFFSFPVNFQAIARFVELRGGEAILNRSETAPFTVALLSQKPGLARECFQKIRFGPLDTSAENVSEVIQRLEESHWDATLFFFFLDRIGDAMPIEGMKRVKEQFFPLFPEEILLLQRLAFLFQSMGEEAEAAECFRIARELEHSLYREPPRGAVLQVGGERGIPWGSPIEGGENFDTILLFPPRVSSRTAKPLFIREIEERFSLDTKIYSDADIETFFAAMPTQDEIQILQFFLELREGNNITQGQLEAALRRLGKEVPLEEDDRFFETLMGCLTVMKPGAVLRAFIPGVCHYEDPRFFEKIAIDPYFEIEETREDLGVWLTVRKFAF